MYDSIPINMKVMTKTREVDFSKGKEANIYGRLGLENEIKKKINVFRKRRTNV